MTSQADIYNSDKKKKKKIHFDAAKWMFPLIPI